MPRLTDRIMEFANGQAHVWIEYEGREYTYTNETGQVLTGREPIAPFTLYRMIWRNVSDQEGLLTLRNAATGQVINVTLRANVNTQQNVNANQDGVMDPDAPQPWMFNISFPVVVG